MYNFLKTTFLGGVLFLPVVVLIAIIAKALEVAKPVVVPLNDALFQSTVAHAYVGDLLTFALLLVFCFWPVSLPKRPSRASLSTRWRKKCSTRFPPMTV
jgi:hypothetical protein